MIYLAAVVVAVAGAYQLLVLAATVLHLLRRDPTPSHLPPVSILKPVHGVDPRFRECIRSHAAQDYGDYEILFGVSDPDDPAIPEIERLMREHPDRAMRLIRNIREAPNGKVGVLEALAEEARYPILVISDSDISVPRDYLRSIVAPLERPGVGLVTCLYRAGAKRLPGQWEALGIDTDFAASVLVARLITISEFALGSTLALRAEDLRASGGFAVLRDYIADDYQLGKRITALGRSIYLSRTVVETELSGGDWGEVWRHQVRWARTVRVSRGDGYAGLPVTFATLWSGVLALMGYWGLGLPLLALRVLGGVLAGAAVLKSRLPLALFFLIPLRDLWAVAVWAAGLFGRTVIWRDCRMVLSRDGRIERVIREAAKR